jgi:Icc-related predicted phosphoesterase
MSLRVAALGDLHVTAHSRSYSELFAEISSNADVLILCGDLTNLGLPDEAARLAADISALRIPVCGVLGNHDHESGAVSEIERILENAGLGMLELRSQEINGIGFAGVKGFGGGFGRFMLGSFGEDAVKKFVDECVQESLRLENRLHELSHLSQVVVALHYAPIAATIEGEPKEIWPYLGSSRLEETLDRFDNIKAVFHGHAHGGASVGATRKNIPVYNTSMHIAKAGGRPYTLVEF